MCTQQITQELGMAQSSVQCQQMRKSLPDDNDELMGNDNKIRSLDTVSIYIEIFEDKDYD